MNSSASILMKSMSQGIVTKVVATFDRLTLVIISVCWAATVAITLSAIYTISLSVHAQHAAEAALATEPNLPQINQSGVGGKELTTMIDSLKRHYPEISISWNDNKLSLETNNGGAYHQWLTAIGQVDTLYPQFHWTIKKLCIGKECGNQNLMQIELTGQKISLEMPHNDDDK